MPDGGFQPICTTGDPAPIPCPTFEMLVEMISYLPPRGMAWQSHEDIVEIIDGGHALTVQQQFWSALADYWAQIYEIICAVQSEFYCATASQLLPEWRSDYGFPDDCEPFDSLCEKVSARPGNRCADYVALAASRGWSVDCYSCEDLPPPRHGCGVRLGSGARYGCGCSGASVSIAINLDESPSSVLRPRPRHGCGVRLGCGARYGCGPNLAQVACLIDRVRPAHIRIFYTTRGGE